LVGYFCKKKTTRVSNFFTERDSDDEEDEDDDISDARSGFYDADECYKSYMNK
jgi:hypothetical protein